jgi:hypothetical protein
LAIPSGAVNKLTNQLRAEWSIQIRSVTICRVAVVGAEFQRFRFLTGRQALRSVRRVWRLMMICVATEFSMDASHGRTSRRSRTRIHNRLELSHDRNHDLALSRERSRRVVILKIVVQVDDRSGREHVKDRKTPVGARLNRRLKMRHAMSNHRRRLRRRRARNLVWSVVNQRRRR